MLIFDNIFKFGMVSAKTLPKSYKFVINLLPFQAITI